MKLTFCSFSFSLKFLKLSQKWIFWRKNVLRESNMSLPRRVCKWRRRCTWTRLARFFIWVSNFIIFKHFEGLFWKSKRTESWFQMFSRFCKNKLKFLLTSFRAFRNLTKLTTKVIKMTGIVWKLNEAWNKVLDCYLLKFWVVWMKTLKDTWSERHCTPFGKKV